MLYRSNKKYTFIEQCEGNGVRVIVPCTPVSSTNKTDCRDITEILLKVALSTITLTPLPSHCSMKVYFLLLRYNIILHFMVGFSAFNMYSMAPFYGEMKAEKNGMAAYNIPNL
jgi:hypothetical protein